MALNPTIFKTRTLTAAVFVIVMLAGLLWNEWSFFILFSIIHFGAWHEYQRLIAGIDGQYATISPLHRYGVMIAGWCLMWYFTNEGYRIGTLSFHVIGWWTGLVFLFVLPLGEIIFTRVLNVRNILYSAAGLVYISLSLALLTHIRTMFYGNIVSFWGSLLVLIIIGSIWINDTMAYIVGSLIGKTPFSKISPKKTWEGTLGGIILAVVVIGVIGFFFTRRVNGGLTDWGWILQWAVIAAIAAVTGTAGDLLESKLKRMAGVKDSGHIMPGHGGFLDRFDSLLVATPFVWLYIMWLLG
ncbi:MAG TPA: phosphatidate cytidylyltransferase [Puia sp.]|jgi:phosphatidate cytidylyltransferase|nr:phosphatidate cytidylyltransferase [Puia sp.]